MDELKELSDDELAAVLVKTLPPDVKAQVLAKVQRLAVGIAKASHAIAVAYDSTGGELHMALALATASYIKSALPPDKRAEVVEMTIEVLDVIVLDKEPPQHGKDRSREGDARRRADAAPGVPEAGDPDAAATTAGASEHAIDA
ncbi:MAG TPA: hypothetical protein VF760_00630 [Xanthobacteraceae bacterium]